MRGLKTLSCRNNRNLMEEYLCELVIIAPDLEYLDVTGSRHMTNTLLQIAADTRREKKQMMKLIISNTAIDANCLTEKNYFLDIVQEV